jgi:hypothetical protein
MEGLSFADVYNKNMGFYGLVYQSTVPLKPIQTLRATQVHKWYVKLKEGSGQVHFVDTKDIGIALILLGGASDENSFTDYQIDLNYQIPSVTLSSWSFSMVCWYGVKFTTIGRTSTINVGCVAHLTHIWCMQLKG